MLQRGGGFSFAFFKRAANWVMFAITFFATVNRGRWWRLFWFALYANELASCSSTYPVFRGKNRVDVTDLWEFSLQKTTAHIELWRGLP